MQLGVSGDIQLGSSTLDFISKDRQVLLNELEES